MYLVGGIFGKCKDDGTGGQTKKKGEKKKGEKKEVCAKKWYHQEDKRIQRGVVEDWYQQSFTDGSGAKKSECGDRKL